MTRHARGRGRSRGNTEDRSRSADVGVDARLSDPEVGGNLFRRQTARDRAENLTLTIGERVSCTRASADDALGKHIAGENPDERGNGALHQEGERP